VNAADLIDAFGTDCTLRRPDGPVTFVKGEAVAAEVTESTFVAYVEPITGYQLQSMEEGQRAREPILILTTIELRAASVANQTAGDVVLHNSIQYEISKVSHYAQTDLAHWEAEALRVEKQ